MLGCLRRLPQILPGVVSVMVLVSLPSAASAGGVDGPAVSCSFEIDPRAYSGDYYIIQGSVSTRFRGISRPLLSAGTYTFDNAAGGRFTFDLDSGGGVTNVSNQSAAVASGCRLELQTTTIEVDPQQYSGLYFVGGMIAALPLFFDNWSGGRFTFNIDSVGTISNIGNHAAASSSGHTLVLNNTSVDVDPQQYVGRYFLGGYNNAPATGRRAFVLVPGLAQFFDNWGGGRFTFDVDANGTVGRIAVPAAASSAGTTLVLNNTTITVDPQRYGGQYHLTSFDAMPRPTGPAELTVVPGLPLTFDNESGDRFTFTVRADGSVAEVANAIAAQAVGTTLLLANACVAINPGGYQGAFYVLGHTASVGPVDRQLIPGTRFVLRGDQEQRFLVNADGTTVPSQFTLPISGQPVTFTLGPGSCDSRAPVTSASGVPSGWQRTDVTVTLTAADEPGGSGVRGISYSASGAAAIPPTVVNGSSVAVTFSADGTTTLTFFATDMAGNIEAAQTVTVTIDRQTPTVSIDDPAATTYLLNQSVTAAYRCFDTHSGVASCAGPVPSGDVIPTGTVGSKVFTVDATDNAGNRASSGVSYTVGYGTTLLYDRTRAVKSGAVIPIKLALADAAGANVSSQAVVVTGVQLQYVSTNTTNAVIDAGDANPDNNFRYDPALGGYIFNLKTTGLATGTWRLLFRAGDDPIDHVADFQVR
jgi:hypothetical protein